MAQRLTPDEVNMIVWSAEPFEGQEALALLASTLTSQEAAGLPPNHIANITARVINYLKAVQAKKEAAQPVVAPAGAEPPSKRVKVSSKVTPSDFAYFKNWNRAQHRGGDDVLVPFQCFRPDAKAVPELPISLVDPALGIIKHAFDKAMDANPNIPPAQQYCEAAVQFCDAMSGTFNDEYARQTMFIDLVNALCSNGVDIRPSPAGGTQCLTDGSYYIRHGTVGCLVYVQEVRVEPGLAGDTYFQGQFYYQLDMRALLPKGLLASFTCPALLVELQGPHLRVCALACVQDIQVICHPLTPFLHLFNMLGHDSLHMLRIARTLEAMVNSMLELQKVYKQPPSNTRPAADDPTYREPSLLLPYPLRSTDKFTDVKRMDHPSKHMYNATSRDYGSVVVKFTDGRYGEVVHKAWAQAGCAPALYQVERLHGGMTMVVMEHLGGDWKAFCSLEPLDREAAKPFVDEQLHTTHALLVYGAHTAHGDLRPANVFVQHRAATATWLVNFIDFDWAGQEGEVVLPAFVRQRFDFQASARAITQEYDKQLWSATWQYSD